MVLSNLFLCSLRSKKSIHFKLLFCLCSGGQIYTLIRLFIDLTNAITSCFLVAAIACKIGIVLFTQLCGLLWHVWSHPTIYFDALRDTLSSSVADILSHQIEGRLVHNESKCVWSIVSFRWNSLTQVRKFYHKQYHIIQHVLCDDCFDFLLSHKYM